MVILTLWLQAQIQVWQIVIFNLSFMPLITVSENFDLEVGWGGFIQFYSDTVYKMTTSSTASIAPNKWQYVGATHLSSIGIYNHGFEMINFINCIINF